MAAKLTLDLPNKRIIVKAGYTSLNVAVDIYSALKADWLSSAKGEMKYEFPIRVIGGDPLPGGLKAGSFFFLRNDLGWRIRPQEADHELIISGNLYPEDTAYPLFVPTVGGYTVSIGMERASLTQAVAAVQASVSTIAGSVESAQHLAISASTIVPGLVVGDASNSVTGFLTNLTEDTDNHYSHRSVIFHTGALAGQAAAIEGYTGATKRIICTVLTEVPNDGDEFVIV